MVGLLVLLAAGPAPGQHAEQQESEHELETRNEVALFLGALSNLHANETGPSVGADYVREVSETLGFGLMAKFARAGEREALVAASVVVRAVSNVKVVIAPGFIVEEPEEEPDDAEHGIETSREISFVARLGVAYGFESSRVTLAPTVYFDIVGSPDGGVTAHLVYGVSIGFPF